MARSENTIRLCNMTYADIRDFEKDVLAACDNGGILPEELADVFTLERAPVVNADGSPRWVLRFA